MWLQLRARHTSHAVTKRFLEWIDRLRLMGYLENHGELNFRPRLYSVAAEVYINDQFEIRSQAVHTI